MKGSAAVSSAVNETSLRGVVFLIAGISIFSFQDVAIKWLSGDYTVHEIMLVRSVVAAPTIVLIAWWTDGLRALLPSRPWIHLVRSCATFFAYTLYYLGLAALPLAEAVTLYYSAPLFITLLAIPFLAEHVGWRRGLAILVGFGGVFVMLRPGDEIVDLAALLVLGSSLAYAASAIVTRRLGVTETGVSMAFSGNLFNLAAAALVGLALGGGSWDRGSHASLSFLLRAWTIPSWGDLGLMALCGVIFGFGYYCLTQAYRVGRASMVAPFEYTALPWSVFWGWVAWRELPDLATLAGLVLIVGSGLYVLRRERAVGQRIVAGKAIRPRL
jgi:S-adenosylmethionine uptake transporter